VYEHTEERQLSWTRGKLRDISVSDREVRYCFAVLRADLATDNVTMNRLILTKLFKVHYQK